MVPQPLTYSAYAPVPTRHGLPLLSRKSTLGLLVALKPLPGFVVLYFDTVLVLGSYYGYL